MSLASMRALWAAPALSIVLATLAACGGGGGSSSPATDSTPASTAAAGYWVRAFGFADASNYTLRYYYSDNVVDSAGQGTYYDVREATAGGKPAVVLYDTTLFVTAQGWQPSLNGATPNTSTSTSSTTSTYNYNSGYVGQSTREDTDVSGQSIASVVALTQNLGTNTLSTTVGVSAAGLQGTMPAGAKLRKISNADTSTPIGYRVSDGSVGNGVTTLTGMVSTFPVPAAGTTITTSNSVSLGGLHGSAGCGTTVCTQERLRAAFGANNGVTYYLCDVNTTTSVQSNCLVAGTGSFAYGTAVDGATPILTFAGLPAATSVQTFTRVFVQTGGKVYFGYQDKPDSSTQTRLNKVAFEALAAALGIAAPTIPDHPSAVGGIWSVTYAGGDTGNCAAMAVNAAGHVIGTCTSTGVGGSFIVSGSAAANGGLSVGSTSSDASFSGSLAGTAGSGTWSRPSASATGTWTATKQ